MKYVKSVLSKRKKGYSTYANKWKLFFQNFIVIPVNVGIATSLFPQLDVESFSQLFAYFHCFLWLHCIFFWSILWSPTAQLEKIFAFTKWMMVMISCF